MAFVVALGAGDDGFRVLDQETDPIHPDWLLDVPNGLGAEVM